VVRRHWSAERCRPGSGTWCWAVGRATVRTMLARRDTNDRRPGGKGVPQWSAQCSSAWGETQAAAPGNEADSQRRPTERVVPVSLALVTPRIVLFESTRMLSTLVDRLPQAAPIGDSQPIRSASVCRIEYECAPAITSMRPRRRETIGVAASQTDQSDMKSGGMRPRDTSATFCDVSRESSVAALASRASGYNRRKPCVRPHGAA
jgi:hypothetical protein